VSAATVTCPSCGQENPAGFRLCGMCGASLLAEPAAAREERKVVTVLFCDLVGFTGRAEQLDPEEVRALLSGYHQRLRGELERHGGTVEKFIGDAVVAVFGAPVVHEDDPERAVRAALAIRDWALEEEDVEVRIAVNTGEALVSVDARPEAGEGLVAGDVVNTASRLQGAAPVNSVLVGESTYRSTERAIEYREHDPVQAKGKAQPVPVWEAVAARSAYGVDVDTRPAVRLVGRRRELDQLIDALARAREEREPQLVTIVAVPGMGKSRLIQELFGAVDADPELITWRQGRSLPYGEGVSFWALGEMVKAHAGILETDPPDAALSKLHSAVADVCEAADAPWVASALGPLVGLGDTSGSGDRREEAFAAWRRFLEGIAEQGPAVLVFEDLHWADDGLLDFVDHLVDWAADVPLLVVASARPELLARRPGWGGGKSNAATLSLAPLSERETAELVHSLLERAVLPADVQAAVLARAGGNPLYAEEFARMVAERGLDGADGELPVPETLQGIVAARLDGLDRDEKQLLQNAAVVGKVFWPAALGLEGELEGLLHGLERREFVRRERRSGVAGQSQYAFRHVLVRDVAYGQIPRSERAAKHDKVAQWIESLGRGEDVAELLAHHYVSALEYTRAAGRDTGALGVRARRALRDAGRRAVALNAFATAFRFYERAAELTPRDDPEWPQLALEHAMAGMYVSLASDRLLVEARDTLLAGDPSRAAHAEMVLGEYRWLRGERAVADEHFRMAESLVDAAPESPAKVAVLANLSRFDMLADEHDRAIALGREALAMAEKLGLDEMRAHALNTIGVSRVQQGDDGGLADLEASREIARGVSAPEYTRASGNLASVLVSLGQLERAAELHEEALEIVKEVGLLEPIRWLSTERAIVLSLQGRWDEARRIVDPLVEEFEHSPFWIESSTRVCRARMSLATGATDQARSDAGRSREVARAGRDVQQLGPSLGFGARLHAELDDAAGARELAEELLDRWRETGFATMADDWVIELWFALWRLGREAQIADALESSTSTPWTRAAKALMRRDFASAAEIVGALGADSVEALIRLWHAEWLVAQGRRPEADAELQRALPFWRSVGATRYVRESEALLAAAS
jgi:class 3 adenylate cyclase/tetratricopeptide (TPR) repeat protein